MRLLTGLVFFGLSFAPVTGADPMGHLRPVPAETPVGKDFEPPTYRGRIVGLTDKTISLKLTGSLRIEEITFNSDRTVKEKKVYVQDNNQPPKVFVFGDQLRPLPGGRNGNERGHNISDLREGDVVQISCCRDRGVDYCNVIEIHRRPGGKVPPAVGDEAISASARRRGKNEDHYRWDVRRNTEQAREEAAFAWLVNVGSRFLR